MRIVQKEEWGQFRYFKEREFLCKCGICEYSRIAFVSYDFVMLLERLRTLAETPFIITSGSRCRVHNERVGGSLNSDHLSDKSINRVCVGADILVQNNAVRYKMDAAFHRLDVLRIGVYKTFFHVGLGKDCVPVKWVG
jgi:hypothetical protein